MKKELENELFSKYPDLFTQHAWGLSRSCMARGIECRDGWYDIIDGMCTDIAEYCAGTSVPVPTFAQIKEKFGCLRVYVDDVDHGKGQPIWDIISLAEEKSEHTCEVCGKPGELDKGGSWWRVRCDEGCT